MKIIILGAGAVGSYYGAKLAPKNDVLLIARKEHVNQINKNKLSLQGVENKKYEVAAATNLDSIEKNTLILLATKAYDSEDTIKKIQNKLCKDTIILCVQNGYGTEDIVKNIVGNTCTVLRTITTIGIQFSAPGVIQVNHHGKTIIEKSDASDEIKKLFIDSGLDSYISENIKEEVWKKLIVNCMVNPLTAIFRVKNREIITRELEPLLRQIADECIAVAQKEGITIKRGYVDEVLGFLKRSENTSSMCQDVRKAKRTEIDFLNGAVAGLGKKYGIQTPTNEAMACMIRFLENCP